MDLSPSTRAAAAPTRVSSDGSPRVSAASQLGLWEPRNAVLKRHYMRVRPVGSQVVLVEPLARAVTRMVAGALAEAGAAALTTAAHYFLAPGTAAAKLAAGVAARGVGLGHRVPHIGPPKRENLVRTGVAVVMVAAAGSLLASSTGSAATIPSATSTASPPAAVAPPFSRPTASPPPRRTTTSAPPTLPPRPLQSNVPTSPDATTVPPTTGDPPHPHPTAAPHRAGAAAPVKNHERAPQELAADSATPATPVTARALHDRGFSLWAGYLHSPNAAEPWSAENFRAVRDAGMRTMAIWLASAPDLSSSRGAADGRAAAAETDSYGLPKDVPVALDMEAGYSNANPAGAVAYARAWNAAVHAAGRQTVGYGDTSFLSDMATTDQRVTFDTAWAAVWPHDVPQHPMAHAIPGLAAGLWANEGGRAWQFSHDWKINTPAGPVTVDPNVIDGTVGG